MPYTPPSHRSPASSAPTPPDVSRRSSIQSGSRPALPRSASYLHKHRRTPSASAISDGSVGTITPQGTSDDLKGMVAALSLSVRQSPPPMTDERGMPKGAIISPPDSASSGSDDEDTPNMRGRQLEKLKEAVSHIPQPRTPSPDRNQNGTPQPVHFSFSTSALIDLAKGRKSSHVRSATEPNASILKSADNSLTASEEDTDEDLMRKPQMVRKKSGELVRPALRPSHRRPSSMPGTPVYSKAVHFDSHLEHVRHFLQVDRPLAVSAGSSPVDAYDSDNEYPFPNEDRSTAKGPPYEWELLTSNFPHDSEARQSLPARLEKVWLSSDQKSMVGSIAVANLAFQKSVVCRFTLDYWKTTSEVVAEYSHEIRPKDSPLGHDRFNFSIKLADTANLESKTLFFCIRYNVNGLEYWDNNASSNFQVDFRKKHLPQNGKGNFQGASSRPANGLPRSSRRGSAGPRPKSMPVSFDDFGDDAKFNKFDQPIHEYLGESGTNGGLRLKSKSTGSLAGDNITKQLGSPSGLAFANRYDFGASLNAAVQAAKDITKEKDGLYMKANVRTTKSPPPVAPIITKPAATPAPVAASVPKSLAPSQPAPPANSPTTSIASSSYEELVNKYCFFGSKQSSPNLKDGTLGNGRFDGSTGGHESSTGSTNSTTGSPKYTHAGPAAHHTLKLRENSYLHPGAYPVSPLASPLRGVSPNSERSNASTPRPANARTPSPVYVTYAGTPPNEVNYPSQQQQPFERFPWSGDAHAATAIRG